MNFIQKFLCDYFGVWCPKLDIDDFDEEITFDKKGSKKRKRNILDMLTDVAEEYRGKGGKTKRRRRRRIN
jgi:hypothetical protein